MMQPTRRLVAVEVDATSKMTQLQWKRKQVAVVEVEQICKMTQQKRQEAAVELDTSSRMAKPKSSEKQQVVMEADATSRMGGRVSPIPTHRLTSKDKVLLSAGILRHACLGYTHCISRALPSCRALRLLAWELV
mmetsp:Transcript_100190/g.188791  ORF Transcript_100190/g.188791 Transcript_100190/m.188791 type:complete len:134 (-) Transcript_100190:16-417(-)